MFLVYIWLYTLVLTLIWWLFIVLRIHAYKFKNFSYNIAKVTNFLLLFLILFSILWYLFIIFWSDYMKEYDVRLDDSENINYDEIDY